MEAAETDLLERSLEPVLHNFGKHNGVRSRNILIANEEIPLNIQTNQMNDDDLNGRCFHHLIEQHL